MKTNRLVDSFMSLFAVLLAYALTFGLALWREAVMFYYVNHWGPVSFIIQMIVILFIFATSLMALNWLINQKMRPNGFVSSIVLISGCILLSAPFFSSYTRQILFIFKYNYPGTLLSYTTTFITVICIIGLIRSFRNRNQDTIQRFLNKVFMKNNPAVQSLVSLSAVLLMLAIAYILDLWRAAALLRILNIGLKLGLFTVHTLVIHTVLMICFIALNWFINSKIRPNMVVSWIIFLGGCLFLLLPLILGFVTAITFFRDQWFRMTLLYITYAFIAVIGGIGIIIKKSGKHRGHPESANE